MSMFQGASQVAIIGGTQIAAGAGSSVMINQGGQVGRGIALQTLLAAAAHTALHDSSTRFPMPRCHRNTRSSYLDSFERWMLGIEGEHELARLIWLNGGAGAGKSAIMQSTVERCAPHGAVLGAFFFSRTDSSRNQADVLIPTLAYQLARAFPAAMAVLEPIILRNPLIFKASLQTQAHELLIQPLLYLIETGVIDINSPLRRVFIIDGLDECDNPQKQAHVIHAVATLLQDNLIPVCLLIASRPEIAIRRAIQRENRMHAMLSSITLEDTLEASSDIRQFIKDGFLDILDTHPLRTHIPTNWPHPDSIEQLVQKSSGHFVYAATVMKYISSSDEHPARALQVVQGLVSPRTGNPFVELDALYMHILTSAKYHSQVLGILRHCVLTPLDNSVKTICFMYPNFSPEDIPLFLSDVQALVSLSLDHAAEMRIVLKHASLSDFLRDVNRSCMLYVHEGVYKALFLPQYFQLLDNGPQLSMPLAFSLTDLQSNYEYPAYLMIELADAIAHSQDIGLLHSLISRHSPRDVWNFVIKAWSLNPDPNIRRELPRGCIITYMEAIRDSVANHNNTLYIDQFKMYVQILMDNIHSQLQTNPHYRILPALMFSSGSVSCLGNVAPLLLKYFLIPRHNIDEHYFCYFLLMITRRWVFCDRAELHLKSYEAFRSSPHTQISWSSDLAYALILVLQHLVGDTWTPEFMRPNVHKHWLNQTKPMQHISQGSPQLSSNFPFKSYFYRRRQISRYMDITYIIPHSHYAELKRYSRLSQSRVARLFERRRECFVLLRAVIFYLHKCDSTRELARLARKLLPKAALWFPGHMKRARAKMDAYVRRWEESLDGLLEKSHSLHINDMD